jgi:hypothetical protein
MRRILVKWAGAMLLAWGCLVSEAHAQSNVQTQTGEKEDRVPALQYTLAALMTILILLIACMPSRKRYEG